VTLCTAKVRFTVNEKTFEQVVAVARQGMLNNKVLFSVPMDDSMAMRLLLGAVDPSSICEGEAGHSGDTPDTQSSDNKDAAGPQHDGETGVTTSSLEAAEMPTQLNAVTRAGQWMHSLAQETEKRRDSEVEPLSSPVPDGTELPSTGEAEEPVAEVQDEVLLVASEEDLNDQSIEDSSLGCPKGRDSADIEKLRADMLEDKSLKHCWDLARADKM